MGNRDRALESAEESGASPGCGSALGGGGSCNAKSSHSGHCPVWWKGLPHTRVPFPMVTLSSVLEQNTTAIFASPLRVNYSLKEMEVTGVG